MNNELKQHKKSDKIKWIITFVALGLVFILLAGVFMQLFGKGKAKPTEWFIKTEQTESISDDIVEAESVSFSLLRSVSTTGLYGTYYVRVLTEPLYAVVQGTISVNWENPDSDWAKGKKVTDYVICEATDYEYQYAVICKNLFSESIIITFTTTVGKLMNCSRRIECVGDPGCFWYNDGDYGKYVDSIYDVFYIDDFEVNEGTIVPDLIYGDVECELNSDLLDYLNEKGWDFDGYCEYSFMYAFTSELTLDGILIRMLDEAFDVPEGRDIMQDIAEYVDLYREIGDSCQTNGISDYFCIVEVYFYGDSSYNGTDYEDVGDGESVYLNVNSLPKNF